MEKLLAGDTALVTGAGNGIGKGIAAALEEEGAKVMRADVAEADLSRPGEALKLSEKAIKVLGKVSIFVHAASPKRHEIHKTLEVSETVWREMQEVNLNAAFLLSQALGKHMVEKQIRGRMLIITSLHAESPRNLPHYSSSKAGQT